MMKKSLNLLTVIVVLGLLGFGVVQSRSTEGKVKGNGGSQSTKAATTSSAGTQKKALPVVKVERVTPQLVEKTAFFTGTVTPTRTARLASPGEGPVETCSRDNCMAREGDHVEKGQPLMQIRHKTAEAQKVAAAQILQEQKAELQRIKLLVEGGAIPGAQLDSAQSKYENARAQLAKAEELTGDYRIKAPWKGVVSKVFVTEGDYVAPRVPLIEIFDPASLIVRFSVPESQSTLIKNDMPTTLQLDAYPGRTFHAKISRIFPQLDIRMRTRTVEVMFTDRVDLLPGMFARIKVLLQEIPDAVTVPLEAVSVTAKGEYGVFLLKDGKVLQQKVQVGIEDANRIQVIAGLELGDLVIVAGNAKLKNGTKVEVRKGAQL